ncbi:conserved membrane hypothetical protein [Arthrobacter sp. 9AX]|uniref:hypothetical protein n=1 Tax=Arthrobacter sp. 9AX TaxID=2653131 RepID=UPI0012F36716|nr:hypothetical protein [Arthrobacter sp. 9AX]VXB56153.1 conserved membrane hypothetical protein [Arthrobacter sp. 9AX]
MSRAPENPADPRNPSEGSWPKQPDGGASRVRPPAVLVVAVIVAAEATALLAAAAWYGYQLFAGSPVMSFWGAVFTLGLLLAFSTWLYTVSLYLYRGYRWTRAAALVAQLFVLTIGFPTLSAGLPIAGLAMLLPAATAVVLLFHNKVISFASRTGSSTPAL